MNYTFGDNHEASRRLRRLAEVYEPETLDLLALVRQMLGNRQIRTALDLGCGPGWSTQLIAARLVPVRIVGLEVSSRYVWEARSNHPSLEFMQHDVRKIPFPISNVDFLFCRFLLTHLESPHAALKSWAQASRVGALLAIHETESIDSQHPALSRYYEMVTQMQRHYGQELNVGASLDAAFAGTDWVLVCSESVFLEKSARDMAQLHVANLRTWRTDEFAIHQFAQSEIEQLERNLELIAAGQEDAGMVSNIAKRIVAKRI
jgi:SAM-dependent methyltransferase